MKKTGPTLIASLALATAGLASAEEGTASHTLTANVTLASEYLYRGIAQTNHQPAVQGGFDLGHRSGLYFGVWGSNISWLADAANVSAPVELDAYGGYKGAVGDFSYDVGGLYYYYPGSYPQGFVSPDTFEAYAGVGYGFLTFKVSYAFTDLFGARTPEGDRTRGSYYLDLTANYPVAPGYTLVGHVGRQQVEDYGDASYTDYRLGGTAEALGLTFGLFYSATNAKGGPGEFYRNPQGKDLGASRVLFTISKSL